MSGPKSTLHDRGKNSKRYKWIAFQETQWLEWLLGVRVGVAITDLVVQIVLPYHLSQEIHMASPVAIRLDRATRQRITRIARAKRKTASQVMREAIETGLQQQEKAPIPPYELMSGLIGVVHSGDPAGSTDMGRKFISLLKSRRSRS